ncbi:unnamed protein product [Cladocopium goreaui]|uniref:Acyltransferase family protein n=1 Tax=Cladocopium goreaui TaxID=2562237 RepID=A0A9P1BMB3_9DINO|nr:unnamed protein product [Cladocopium goreaui]
MGRLIYLDNLRSILSVLVVGHHSFLAASGLGRWYCSSAERHDEQIAMAFVATILFTSQAFLTGLLFGVAGLLMPRSLAKKGPSGHMVSRLWRLGLPVLLVGLPTHHLSQWLGHKLSKANVKLSESESASFQLSSGPGVAWFELWLLTFESIFVVLRGSQPIKIVPQNFSFLKVFCILLAIAIVQYSVEMHLAKPLAEFLPGWKGLAHHIIHTPLYGFCFLCGSLSDSTALLTMLRVHTKPLSITSGLAIGLCFLFALGRQQSQPERAVNPSAVAIGSIMTVLICAGACNGVLQRFNTHHSAVSILSDVSCLSYAVNMLHPVVVVLLTPLVVELPLGLLVQCILLWLASSLASFAVAALLRSSPYVRRLL